MRRRSLIAGALTLSLALTACGGEDPDEVEVEEPAEADAGDEEAGEDATDDDAAEDDADEDAAAAPDADDADEADPDTSDAADAGEQGPAPDPADLEDPCADHQGREDDMFIDLVSPVDGQVVGSEVELVGCSNVFEANVVWNLLDGDGVLLDEGFTTAECGTGCVGEFRETISLAAADGEPVGYLQVFSPDMSDANETPQALTEVVLTLQ